MELDPGTAILTILAFVGGQVVIALIQEVRASREAARQRAITLDQRRHDRERELAESRRRFHQEYIDASRQTYLTMCDLSALMASGRGEEAAAQGKSLALSSVLAKSDATLLTIDGDPTVLLAFAGMMAGIAEHLDEPPDLARRLQVNDVASLIAGAFFAQELRLANGEEPIRMTDRRVLSQLQESVATMRDGLAGMASKSTG